MDRRVSRVLAIGGAVIGIGVLVTAPGCRSTRSEVPPGKPYSTTGGGPPAVGFSSGPRTGDVATSGGIYGNNPLPGALAQDPNSLGGGSASSPMGGMAGSSSAPVQYGTPAPTQGLYGAPTSNRYGSIPAVPGSSNPAGSN